MPIRDHPSFNRPSVATPLWRYTDVPKFLDLLTSGTLWLTNAEILARDDPYEGLPGAVQFPHRMWRTIDEVPEPLRQQIVKHYGQGADEPKKEAFRAWVMLEEQGCIMTRSGRRDFYVNCWHAANHESAAMWKIYASPGAGVAVVTNGARLETALAANTEDLKLGAVQYRDPSEFAIGRSNAYDTLMIKRSSYSYEQEVRLVHWRTGEMHDALVNDRWNEATMRFDDLVEDTRPINPGVAVTCDVDVLIERVLISPFAPPWYAKSIETLRDRLGFKFPIEVSMLLSTPPEIP